MGEKLDPVLRLTSLSKIYEGGAAVHKIDLDVWRGEFLALLGPSGCGKTTTLLMIAGFEQPTEGDVILNGASMRRIAPHERHIGIVFQHYALFPHLSVFENIAFSLRNRPTTQQEISDRVREMLKMIRLEGFESRFPSELSGGQQQRVAIARALAFRPALLLLDEPLGALDKRLRQEMLLELRRLHRELGVTMVYVTHDHEEALTMADRIAVMNHGEIVRLGTPRQLYDDPQSVFVADFLGEINVIEATAVDPAHVSAFGTTFHLEHNVTAGNKIMLGLRPEHTVIGGASNDWNHIEGKVEEVLFLGESSRVRVATNGATFLATVSNSLDSERLAIGDHVTVSWRPADARILSA